MRRLALGFVAILLSVELVSAAKLRIPDGCNWITAKSDIDWSLHDNNTLACITKDIRFKLKSASYAITDCNSHMDFPNFLLCSPQPICDYLTKLGYTPAC